MNLFFLHIDPKKCAEQHCDKHVVKMVLEIVQMLYTSHHVSKTILPDFAYKVSHIKHPTSIWIRRCYENYSYAVSVAKYLSIEYTYRYHKIHSCQKHIEWLSVIMPIFREEPYNVTTQLSYNKYFESIGMTPVPLAMPDECKLHPLSDTIKNYRNYYNLKKQRFARWTSRVIPRWYTPLNIRHLFIQIQIQIQNDKETKNELIKLIKFN